MYIMYILFYNNVDIIINMTKIIKARERQGTKSLDITIPTEIQQDYNINKGDLFKIDVENIDNKIKIIYTRIYKEQK